MTTYETPGCAYCPSNVRACRVGESEPRGPGYCPSKTEPEAILEADAYRREPFLERVATASALVESEGYCKWTRVEEICQFARKMGFKRVGIATGILITALHHCGLATLTHTPSPMDFLNQILRRPENERPFLLLLTGYPAAEAHVPLISKKPLSEIATFL